MTADFAPPKRALWEITWACDLRCDHCLVEGGRPKEGELDTDEACRLVDDLADLGVSAVSLTGGEPLLRKDWKTIAERVRRRSMALRFSLNGHLLDDETAGAFCDLGVESLSVSIDGVKETHDRIRHGPGAGVSSFDRVIAAIERLRPTPIVVTVRTTICGDNVGELPSIHALLKTLGVDRWVLQLAHRTGRLSGGGADGRCTPLRPNDLPRVAAFITANADDPILAPSAFNSIGYLSRDEPIIRGSGRGPGRHFWRGCTCGLSTIGSEPDGGIKGCANQIGAPFVVGNVRTEPLRAIWNDRPRWHWLNPPPERMTGECAGCALARVCQAGCTVLAFRSSGELFNNPYCLRRMEKQREARG